MVNGKRRRRRADWQDRTGSVYGNFVVIAPTDKIVSQKTVWLCQCQKCGHEKEILSQILLQRRYRGVCPKCATVQPESIQCPKCEQTKPFTQAFFVAHKECPFGLSHTCKDCHYLDCSSTYWSVRLEVMSHYSGGDLKCACCGEDKIEFLALDHVNGGGRKHCRLVGDSLTIMRDLKKNGYPSGFRVLCHNCNSCLGYYGKCIHQEQFDPIAYQQFITNNGKPNPVDQSLNQQTTETRKCRRCKQEHPLNTNYFYKYKTGSDVLSHTCIHCKRSRSANSMKMRRRKLRVEVILQYGGKCACCGEDTMQFLTMDHVNGNGCLDRKQNGNLYARLKRNGFPRDGYRVLCHNCNVANGHHGCCPHSRTEG